MAHFDTNEFESDLWVPPSAKIEEYTHRAPIDPLYMFIGMVSTLVDRARSAEHQAESYRGFNVTASAFVYDHTENRTGIITSANYKARVPEDERDDFDVEDIPKVCAEMDIIQVAGEAGFETIVGLVVAGTSNKQKIFEVTGRHAATLVPCEECQQLVQKSPLAHDKTFVISVGMVRDIWQFFTVGGLRETYEKSPAEFHDPIARDYSPFLWPDYQQIYADRKKSEKLNNPRRKDISRSRPHLKIAEEALNVT